MNDVTKLNDNAPAPIARTISFEEAGRAIDPHLTAIANSLPDFCWTLIGRNTKVVGQDLIVTRDKPQEVIKAIENALKVGG